MYPPFENSTIRTAIVGSNSLETTYILFELTYRKLVGECKQNGAKCIITKYDAKGQPKVDKRKSIIGRKSILAEKGI